MADFNLDDIVVKEPDQLSAEEKTFLTENKDQLDDDTAKKFGIDTTPVVPDPAVRGGNATPPAKKDGEGDGEGDDEEVDPDDKKRISKLVDQQVAPLKQKFQEQSDILEVDNFIRSNSEKFPIAGKYREAMLRYMKVYSNVPADGVFRIVAGDELMRIGAQKEREAASKANGTRTKSSSARPAAGAGKDWGAASKEEFDAQKATLLGRRS